jgi:glc operon protein GlcG
MIGRTQLLNCGLSAVLGSLLCLCTAARTPAQTSADQYTLSGEAAKKALTKDEISGDTAAKIAQVCQDFAKKHNFAAIVFILDPSGNIVHAHRMDGARPIQFDSALNKARTALFMRTSTHQLANRFANNIAQQIKFAQRNMDPTPGGLPIIVNSQLIGAIGVAGSDPLDEECANTGLTEVLGPQPPLAADKSAGPPAPGQPPQ